VIVLIFGMPGSGKTTLANDLARMLRMSGHSVVQLNGDDVRAELNSDLTFSEPDRITHAWRMGAMARLLDMQGHIVLADFICPTPLTREAFGRVDLYVWMDRVRACNYQDTNEIWKQPIEIKDQIQVTDSTTHHQNLSVLMELISKTLVLRRSAEAAVEVDTVTDTTEWELALDIASGSNYDGTGLTGGTGTQVD
jgi:ABC-type cobalamin/Fe3+-siderophores transport system ATPase subunit